MYDCIITIVYKHVSAELSIILHFTCVSWQDAYIPTDPHLHSQICKRKKDLASCINTVFEDMPPHDQCQLDPGSQQALQLAVNLIKSCLYYSFTYCHLEKDLRTGHITYLDPGLDSRVDILSSHNDLFEEKGQTPNTSAS